MKRVFRASAITFIVFCFASQPLPARGAPEVPPAIQLSSESGVYISPNGDGVQDELVLAPVLTEDATLAVKSFQLTVFGTSGDVSGRVVWTRRDVQPENRGFIGDLFGVGEEPRVEIPDTLTWDGSFLSSDVAPDGATAPDGEYIYQITIMDESRATFSSPPMSVMVDRIAPRIGPVSADYTVFSPNGDGVRDVLPISQAGSREVSWTAAVTDSAGEIVTTFNWENDTPNDVSGDSGPPDTSWDGMDTAGRVAPDGIYSYLLTGTDRAGNSSTSSPIEVRLSTRAGAVQVLPRHDRFSPNGDDSLDTLAFDTIVTEPDGLIEYGFSVFAAGDSELSLWSTPGTAPVPESLEFGGYDERGRVLPDGEYEMVLTVSYENGNRAESEPALFVIDTEPPRGSIAAQTGPLETDRGAVFAFGGTNKQYVDVDVSLSEQSDWIAIANVGEANYRIPLSELGFSGTDFSFRWYGDDLDGNEVPDGNISLRFDTVDSAGNSGRTNQLQVIKDTREAEVSVEFLARSFSPDSDGVNDSVRVIAYYTVEDLIDQFLLSIEDESGRTIRTEYKRIPFNIFEWLGRSNGNTVVPDGEYTATLRIIYHNGNEPSARSGPVTVDVTNPEIRVLTAPYRLFSPDGDGERDSVTIEQQTSEEDEWIGRIVDSDGKVVFERTWAGQADSFTWDGLGTEGSLVPDGDYIYTIFADDVSGNTGSEDLTLVVDTRSAPVSQQPPDVSLSVGPTPFTPDGDGTNDLLMINSAAASENIIMSWELVIRDPFGAEFRRWSGRGGPRRFISWNGEAADGELVQSAQEYTVTLTVTDDRGNTGSESAVIPVGILVIRDGLVLRIMVPSIHFAPYTADLFAVSPEDLEQNLETLRSLATVLNRYPDREILIEGHAAHDYYLEGPRKEREQREELLPLSAARAEEVRQALIILGVDSERMETIGIGGARPIVPHSDRENLWKNRRVEFILERR